MARRILYSFTLLLFISALVGPSFSLAEQRASFYSFKERLVSGEDISFSGFEGKVVLVANVAVRCGTSSQFNDLQKLYSSKPEDLIILGVASNDFTGMEPENHKFGEVCKQSYGVEFPVVELSRIKGQGKSELYEFLTETGPRETRGEVSFNFEKFLIDRKGEVRMRFGSFTGVLSGTVGKELRSLLDE